MNSDKMRKLNIGDEHYLNRELSWLAFNQRVLDESRRDRTPLLERVKFVTIFYSNLDEFFMVRVAGKKRALKEGIRQVDEPDITSVEQTLEVIHNKARELVSELYATFQRSLLPHLAQGNIHLHRIHTLSDTQRSALYQYYKHSVLPVLTPLAVDPAHPFPFLGNRKLYLLVSFQTPTTSHPSSGAHPEAIAFVEVPGVLSRLIPVNMEAPGHNYVLLEDLISEHLGELFFGLPMKAAFPIRVTRNLDINLLESEVVDLLSSIQSEVKAREQAEAVRLEYAADLPRVLLDLLEKKLGLEDVDTYECQGPLALADFSALYELNGEGWKYPAFNPRLPQRMKGNRSIFSLIREADLMLHHPYDSFYAIIELLHEAAWDPDVLAIKQTLYRTSGDSPIIDALILAAEQGKQVTAVVELKARFDENNNIVWARRMERAGVHVVYGFIGLKTHSKMTLIVRRENRRLARYVHLSTGNYNSTTARHYVDIGYITAKPEFGDDVTLLFNILTGFNIMGRTGSDLQPMPSPMKVLIIAPLYMRDRLLQLIDREIAEQLAGGKGRIIAKMNALVDRRLIDKLYEASNAGVEICLIVRSICCLRPGVEGLSENIRVHSVVGRFLEHSRVFYFRHKGKDEVYLGSADWMPRNMDRRIEVIFPVEDPVAKKQIIEEILPIYWADTENTWQLRPDGTYHREKTEGEAVDCHQKFIEIAREQGIKSLPYDKAIRHDLKHKGRPIVGNRSNTNASKQKDTKKN
ncbi:MAG: polyphosphate kinase 1 [Proteobacteria bacterium]|nr:MAG: polyphosphate kinase 1 [Pseudomonadota bacterium]